MRPARHDIADHLGRIGVRGGMVELHGDVGMGVAGKQVDAAQREGAALAGRCDADLLAHQPAAGIHDEQRQPGVLAERCIELAEMRRAVGLVLDDDPDDLGVVADQEMADRADQRVAAAGLALDDGRPGAGADAHREAHMRLAAILHVLQFDRALRRRTVCDVEEEAVGDEGRIDRADRIVGAAQFQRRREAAVLQFLLEPLHLDAVDRHRPARRDPVEDRQHGRTGDQRLDRPGVVCRHRRPARRSAAA